MSRIRITDQFSLVKRGGSDRYYLEWRERGQKVRRATGTSSLEGAVDRARELILEGVEIRDAAPAEIAIVDVLDRYNLQRGSKLASASTIARSCAIWSEFWGSDPVSAATIERLEAFTAWLRARGYSQGYIRRVLTDGRSALNRARKRGELQQVPFIELSPKGEAYPHQASRAQLVAFLTGAPDHLFLYCAIRLCTGCRDDAALDLRGPQIDRAARLVRLNPPGRVQTKKYRAVVPLADTLARLVDDDADYLVNWHGRPIASIMTTWNKVRIAAGLPAWFSPKVLRHTVATELRRRGVPMWEVSGLLGHATGGTSEIYAKFDPSYLASARIAIDAWMLDLSADVPRLRA